LTIAGVLFALFRRISGVLLPLLVVVLSLISTFGALAASGVKLAPPTQILPTFLLSVGTGAVVHILKIFYLHFDEGDAPDDAVAKAIRHSGLAVIMTSLTTAGGLLSFLAAGLTPIIHLGVFAPIGILLALVYCLVLLPALLHVLPLRRRESSRKDHDATWLERSIVRVGDFSVMNPGPVIGGTVLVVALSLVGTSRLEFTQDVMSWIAPSDPLHRATELIDDKLKGSITLELVIDTKVENGVKQPEFLRKLDALSARARESWRGEAISVGKTIAINDVLKEIHQALNSNEKEFYTIPDDPALAAQELLLFENTGSDDLEDVVDSQFQLARFTMKMPYADPLQYNLFIHEVTDQFRSIFGDDLGVVVTGFMGMMGQTTYRVMSGLARSYGLALAIITPLMILLIGNLRGGLVSMVPNLTPIIMTLGIMGWIGITIDMFTMMIGSIAIGLAVDDTIHFIHGFRRDFSECGDARLAVKMTLETTGRALLVTSVVLSSGFLVFVLSDMQNLFYFGLLTSFTIVSAFVIDILVTPALIVLVTSPISGQRSSD
jgi:predicted RND superfamily exporter protein